MVDKQVQLLSERVSQAEHILFGSSSESHDKKKATTTLTDDVAHVHAKLAQLSQQHEVVGRFWSTYGDIASFLNSPSFEDSLLSTGAKEEIILSAEASLKEISEQLHALDSLGDFLNPPAQQDLPTLFTKMSPLEQIHMESRDDLDAISKRLSALLASYNEIVALLSRKFVLWDQAVSSLERKVAEVAALHE